MEGKSEFDSDLVCARGDWEGEGGDLGNEGEGAKGRRDWRKRHGRKTIDNNFHLQNCQKGNPQLPMGP